MDKFSLKYELYLKLGVQLISDILGMEMKMDKFSMKYDICMSEYENENGLKNELYLT